MITPKTIGSRVWTHALLLTALVLTACRGTGRLGEYEYAGRTLAVAWIDPPHPRILTGPYLPSGTDDPLRGLLAAGARIAKEIEASKVRARLDSATAEVDMTSRIAARTLDGASRYLRTRPAADEGSADFVLEVRLRDYGIAANDWNAAAHFFVDAEMVLIDGRAGGKIWDSKVSARDPVSPSIFGPGRVLRDVVTAATFAELTVDEIARALERLGDYAADRMTERLRDALDSARG